MKIERYKDAIPEFELVLQLRPEYYEVHYHLAACYRALGQEEKAEEYRRIFGFIDANDDGSLSTKEFIEDGRYMTRQARQGIF